MDNKIAIFLFSGTGNTAFVTDLLVKEFEEAGIETDVLKIEDIRKGKSAVSVDAHSMIGIAHPVLGFDCPAMIYDFVRSLPAASGQSVFLVKTAADYHRVNYGASKSISKILRGKGYRVFFDELIAMPGNWLVGYPDRLSRNLLEAASHKARIAARRILAHEEQIPKIGFLLRWSLRGIGLLEDRVGAKRFGLSLRTGEACNLCGVCARNCPSGNIENKDGRMRFGDQCLWCMRCIYRCPMRAITSEHMNFFILEGGYSLERLAKLELEPIDFEGEKLDFWTRYFRRYFAPESGNP